MRRRKAPQSYHLFGKVAAWGRVFALLGCTTVAALAREQEGLQALELQPARGAIEARLHTKWESRYVSEGRDNLGGDSLVTTNLELGWQHLTAGVWFGNSPEQEYNELQLAVGVTETFGPLKTFLAYTYLRFQDGDAEDHEISAGAEWTGLPWDLEVTALAYYSVMNEGAFVEAALGREIFSRDRFSLRGSVCLGVNQGYVPDGHDGANHVAVRLESEFALTKRSAITAHLARNWAVDRDAAQSGDAALGDFFHVGVGVQWTF